MTTIQDLIGERARAWHVMKDLLDRADQNGRGLTGEEEQEYQRAEADYDRIDNDIKRREAFECRRDEMERVERPGNVLGTEVLDAAGNTADDYAVAFGLWAAYGNEELTQEQRALLRQTAMSADDLRAIRAAQGTGTGAAGGFTIPPNWRGRLVDAMKFFSGIRQVAEVITTDNGADLPWTTSDDTGNLGAILGENTQVTEQDLTFGTATLGAFMYTSRLVRVSLQLLQDSGFSLDSFLPRKLGERIGRIQNQHFTTGTGTGQPLGLVTGGTAIQATAGQATAFTYDFLIGATDALDPAYLQGANLAWMGSQAARTAIRRLKDSQNRPLWQPSLQAGTPDLFLGYPWVLNNDVPAPAANAKSLLFGDYREAYVIRDVLGFNVLRLTERYADFLQVGFLGFQRTGATVQQTSAYRVLQNSAT